MAVEVLCFFLFSSWGFAMATKTKTAAKDDGGHEIHITPIKQVSMVVHVEGESPLIFHRLGRKAQQELLLPSRKKNQAERETTAKHDPIAEYRESVYLSRDPRSETALVLQAATFKSAIRTAALDIPGAAKSQIGRLTYIEGEEVSIFGTQEIFITEVRNSGMNRTPDMRTRAIMPKWAARFVVRFTVPLLSESTVGSLIAAAGQIIGVGDFRPEKGAGAYGRFSIITEARFNDIKKVLGGRKEQEAALKEPQSYDDDTRELLEWFQKEAGRRSLSIT